LIEFASVVEKARLFDPSGKLVEQVIEHRRDPLTGAVASINEALGEKAKAFLGAADVPMLQALEEKSRETCPFCAAAEKGTRFPPDFAAEGQIRLGSALAMPNLFSKAAFDSVVIVDPQRHTLFPSRIRKEALADAIRVSAQLVRRARAYDPDLVHHIAGMNFLGPGGSSVPHPHFQVHVRGVPYSGVTRLVELGDAFRKRAGTSYWDALLAHERSEAARFIGTTGGVQWIAACAPSHQKEIWGVLPGTSSLAELSDEAAGDFASGIARVLSFYEESVSHAFTLAFLSSPRPDRGFALHVKLCARPAFRANYTNYDTWFGPKLAGDEAHTEAPELYAGRLREHWSDQR
jgi:UDPglucose--hexose-1-phosphate uridylyltransferase